jgi:hypothetical protein
MSRTKTLMAMAVAAVIGTAAQASVVPSFKPVAAGNAANAARYGAPGTPVPLYDPLALAADPALANYVTQDLQVTISAGDRWASADAQTSSSNSTASSNPVGAISETFYAPPSALSGATDQDGPQRTVYQAAASRNFKYDTWINTILSTGVADTSDGTTVYWGTTGLSIAGGGTFPVNHGTAAAVLPRTADNPNFVGGADAGLHTIDVAWGDQQAGNRTYPLPGTYTIARITYIPKAPGAAPDYLVGRVGSTLTPNDALPYAFALEPVPEPTSLALIGLGLGAIALRRRSQ